MKRHTKQLQKILKLWEFHILNKCLMLLKNESLPSLTSRTEVAYLIFLENHKKKWSPKEVQDIRNAIKRKETLLMEKKKGTVFQENRNAFLC